MFREALYPKLVAGQSLELAVSVARHTLLESDDPYWRVQADALAPVLLTANGDCLKTTAAVVAASVQPRIDCSFHLPLPQLRGCIRNFCSPDAGR